MCYKKLNKIYTVQDMKFIHNVFHMMMNESLKCQGCSLIYTGLPKKLDMPGLSVPLGIIIFVCAKLGCLELLTWFMVSFVIYLLSDFICAILLLWFYFFHFKCLLHTCKLIWHVRGLSTISTLIQYEGGEIEIWSLAQSLLILPIVTMQEFAYLRFFLDFHMIFGNGFVEVQMIVSILVWKFMGMYALWMHMIKTQRSFCINIQGHIKVITFNMDWR